MAFITGFFRFWYDFIVGDAWEIAAGIAVVLAGGALLLGAHIAAPALVPPLVAAGVLLVVGGSILAEARRPRAPRSGMLTTVSVRSGHGTVRDGCPDRDAPRGEESSWRAPRPRRARSRPAGRLASGARLAGGGPL